MTPIYLGTFYRYSPAADDPLVGQNVYRTRNENGADFIEVKRTIGEASLAVVLDPNGRVFGASIGNQIVAVPMDGQRLYELPGNSETDLTMVTGRMLDVATGQLA